MTCPNCEDVVLECYGYGDRGCPECGYMEYSESDEDFYNRTYGKKKEQNDNDLEKG